MHTPAELADRYQCQPWHVRCLRWLLHMPLAYCRVAWALARWTYDGAPCYGDDTRGTTREIIVACHLADGQFAMKWFYTMDEVGG